MNENNKKLTGSWSKGRYKKYLYYRFERSGGYDYNRDKIEKAFMEYMDSFSLDDEYYKKLTRFIKEELVVREQIEKRKSENLQKHIQELNTRQTILIKKNVGGVISDAILKQQLDSIDIELTNAHASLYKASDCQIDIQEGVAYLKSYFKAPSEIWSRGKPHTKLASIRFQFPLGCTLINSTFGTTKIGSFFKAKSAFGGANFGRVDLGYKIRNTPKFTKSSTGQANNTIRGLKNKVENTYDEVF